MEWYKRWPNAYKNKTWHLTLAEHGAYNLLIDHYYFHETPLPVSDQALASIIGRPIEEWLAVRDQVLPFFKRRGDHLIHFRCEEELVAASAKRTGAASRQKRHRNGMKPKDLVTGESQDSHAAVTYQEETRGEEKEEDSPPLLNGGGISSSEKEEAKAKADAHLRMMDINAARESAERFLKYGTPVQKASAKEFLAALKAKDDELLEIPPFLRRKT